MEDAFRPLVATFGPGPLGIVLQNVNRYAVVSRLQCRPDGQPGQASRCGITVGCLLVGIAREGEELPENDFPDYDVVRKAVALAARPVRVVFQRLRCVLCPMPATLPLKLWEGRASLLHHSSVVDVSVVVSGSATAWLSRSARGFHLLLSWLERGGFGLDVVDHPGRSVDDAHLNHAKQSIGKTILVSGRLWEGAAAQRAPPTDLGEVSGFPGLTFSNSRESSFQLMFPEQRTCFELYKILLVARFPLDIEQQARGIGRPSTLLRGQLSVWKPILSVASIGRWKTFQYHLRSDGSLQVFILRIDNFVL